jgi:hypothetical protein
MLNVTTCLDAIALEYIRTILNSVHDQANKLVIKKCIFFQSAHVEESPKVQVRNGNISYKSHETVPLGV